MVPRSLGSRPRASRHAQIDAPEISMNQPVVPPALFRKSSASETGNCVEVALGRDVLVRDSKNRNVFLLSFSQSSWTDFVSTVGSASAQGVSRVSGETFPAL
ncbi:DUF397 domain-containing protein [Streptomyces hokutonensis]|uniref:DUF397 domain-containing protein n=1 Tax=Streptomyces hokutonensis TaxID=1306990 RepID=UPI0034100755